MSNLSLIPKKSTGGSPFGYHTLSLFKTCPLKWALTNLYPSGGGDHGLEPKVVGEALSIGSVVHDGLEAWYASGVRDGEDTGERSVRKALSVAQDSFKEYHGKFLNGEVQTAAWNEIESILCEYHDYYGPDPGTPHTEYPALQVAIDGSGEPVLEREYEAPVGYRDYKFTARLDGVVWYNGALHSLEHKTCNVRFVKERQKRSRVDGQFTGQLWLLHTLYPDLDVEGVLCNILVKGRGATSKYEPFLRGSYERTLADMEKFRIDACHTLARMDDAIGRYHKLMATGNVNPWQAILATFDGTPDAYRCTDFGGCDFLDACTYKTKAENVFKSRFKGRVWQRPAEQGFILATD